MNKTVIAIVAVVLIAVVSLPLVGKLAGGKQSPEAGGERSPEKVARAFIEACHADDVESFRALILGKGPKTTVGFEHWTPRNEEEDQIQRFWTKSRENVSGFEEYTIGKASGSVVAVYVPITPKNQPRTGDGTVVEKVDVNVRLVQEEWRVVALKVTFQGGSGRLIKL